MREDFIGGAYNVEEHNHTEWPLDRLKRRADELQRSLNGIEHHPIRKAQIQREIGLIATELYYRKRES